MEIFFSSFYIEIISHLYIKIQSLTSNTNYEDLHTKHKQKKYIYMDKIFLNKEKRGHNVSS